MFESLLTNRSLNYAAFAIPAFFVFLGLEYVTAFRQKKDELFKFDSSIANISIGIAERLLNLFLTASFYGVFTFIYENFAIWSIPNHWAVWIILILVTDLVWYWYHRFGHEVNLFWAAHIVHHHSEEFNYSVSARITTLQAIVRNIFWCILPLAGFHPAMIMTILVVHGTYSFFTHTQIINKLGWLEYILITPSHHRVHHSSNEKYLNKNYGDLFVFWDKLFGTFEKEDEKPVYGLTHPLKSHSFVWQHFHYFMELAYAVSTVKGFIPKLRIIFGKPELLDQNIRPELEKTYLSEKIEANPTFRYKSYLVIQIVITVLILFFVTLFYFQLNVVEILVAASFILLTLVNCGAMLEQRRWIYYLENTRLLLLIGYASYILQNPMIFVVSIVFVVALSSPLEKRYLKFIYGK
ncbi:MAG TPA: sterol desaturase family protein [Cyclobacteriaceae bacterium]|nr:sterol desaturase family protein [Cyclobacteriaceae bacterium]